MACLAWHLAAADHYPWLPVRWIAGIHFNSLRRMPDIRMPVVIAHCLTDKVIPYHHGERLFAAAAGPKQFQRHCLGTTALVGTRRRCTISWTC